MCQHNLPCSIVYAHCLLPGRAFASLYVLLFLEKEAEIGGRVKYASEYKMHTPMYGKICILNANSEDLKCGSSSGSVLFIRIKMTFKDRNTSKLKNSTSDHLKHNFGHRTLVKST